MTVSSEISDSDTSFDTEEAAVNRRDCWVPKRSVIRRTLRDIRVAAEEVLYGVVKLGQVFLGSVQLNLNARRQAHSALDVMQDA